MFITKSFKQAPMPYGFAWAVKDDPSYNDYGQQETSDGKVVTGSYRVLLPDGRTQIVDYKADEYGYTADVKYNGVPKYDDYKPAYKPAYPQRPYKEPKTPEAAYTKPSYAEPPYSKPVQPEPVYTKPSYPEPEYSAPKRTYPKPRPGPPYPEYQEVGSAKTLYRKPTYSEEEPKPVKLPAPYPARPVYVRP